MEYMLAGIWPLVLKYTFAVGGIGAALAFAWFSPVFKKTALWVASGIAIGLVCYHTGVNDGANRIQSQWDAAVAQTVENNRAARDAAERDIAAGMRDPRDRPDN